MFVLSQVSRISHAGRLYRSSVELLNLLPNEIKATHPRFDLMISRRGRSVMGKQLETPDKQPWSNFCWFMTLKKCEQDNYDWDHLFISSFATQYIYIYIYMYIHKFTLFPQNCWTFTVSKTTPIVDWCKSIFVVICRLIFSPWTHRWGSSLRRTRYSELLISIQKKSADFALLKWSPVVYISFNHPMRINKNLMLTFCWMRCHFNLMPAPKTMEIIRWKMFLFQYLSRSTKTSLTIYKVIGSSDHL